MKSRKHPERLYRIEKILDRRSNKDSSDVNNYEYLIKWQGYPESEATWEPVGNLESAMQAIIEFEINQKRQKEERRVEEKTCKKRSKSRPKSKSKQKTPDTTHIAEESSDEAPASSAHEFGIKARLRKADVSEIDGSEFGVVRKKVFETKDMSVRKNEEPVVYNQSEFYQSTKQQNVPKSTSDKKSSSKSGDVPAAQAHLSKKSGRSEVEKLEMLCWKDDRCVYYVQTSRGVKYMETEELKNKYLNELLDYLQRGFAKTLNQ